MSYLNINLFLRDKEMKAYRYILIMLLAVSITLTGCTNPAKPAVPGTVSTTRDPGPEIKIMRILTSCRLLTNIVNEFASDRHYVDSMVNAENTLKTFKPYYQFFKDKNYDSFLYLGAGYEPFITNFLKDVDKNELDVVNLSRGVEILRYKDNNLYRDNPYYLSNSTNYKIVLSNIKNNLIELDVARKDFYEVRFRSMSSEIDELQKQISEFFKGKNVKFISDTDLTEYICKDYRVSHINILSYKKTQGIGAGSTELDSGIKLFLYSDDTALLKYADEIAKYKMIPVKIKFYDYDQSVLDTLKENFSNIKNGIIKAEAPGNISD